MSVATINDIPVQLGDVVSGPDVGCFTNGRVKGISPDGTMLYVGWLGIVKTKDCQWATELKETQFARLYRVVTEDQWDEAITPSPNTAPKITQQLELEIVTKAHAKTDHNAPCEVISNGLGHPGLIPGLDASLCRCNACTARTDDGAWWFDSWMRQRVLKRQTEYQFQVVGDLVRDEE